MTTKTETQPQVTLTRVINAPRELVWKAWTDSKLMQQWWSPRGFTNPVCEIEPKIGGKIRIHMSHPQFPNHWTVGEFKELDKPNKLVFYNNAVIAKDGKGEPALEGLTTVTFEEAGGKTKLTVHSVILKSVPGMEMALAGMEMGWAQTIDKFEEVLAEAQKSK